jgi:hypothetical protein
MSWCQRYKTFYGLPAGRPEKIPDRNKDGDYIEEFAIDEANRLGNLNVGIYVVKRKSDGKKCVQKRIDGTNKQLRTEIHLLHHLKSAHIVEFVDAYITPHPRQASLYIEYCELGSLSALVKRYVVMATLILHSFLRIGVTDLPYRQIATWKGTQTILLFASRKHLYGMSLYV